MSILIKGMKMPKDCPQCPLSHWNKLDQLTGCELVRRYVPESESSYWQSDKRPEWCPLVGLPDHGNLVDMDEFSRAMYHEAFEVDSALQKWESGCWIRYKMFERLRDSAPVIIPAERSEDGGLKPCPFCGGKVSITYNSGEKAFAVWHTKAPCFIEPLWISGDDAKTLNEAYAFWNRRERSEE